MARRRAAVAAAIALSLAACTAQVPGTPDAAVIRPSLTPSPEQLPQAGRCATTALAAVDCAEEHEVEVTEVGRLALDGPYPDERDLRRDAVPACRQALTAYLGSPDHDATRLQAQAFWPSVDGWARGDRWRLCAVVEFTPDGQRKKRRGSAKDLLKAAGFAQVQLCTRASTGQDDPEVTACEGAHLAEAVPGVLVLGRPQDPAPSAAAVDAAAEDHCDTAVAGYVGARRQDVVTTWRTFGSQGWSEGYTSAVCYAEATRPFTGRLWGLGTNALPS